MQLYTRASLLFRVYPRAKMAYPLGREKFISNTTTSFILPVDESRLSFT